MEKYLLLFLFFWLGSCTSSRLVNKADKRFNKGAYGDAAVLYRKAYQQTPSAKRSVKGYIAFQSAESNRHTGRYLRSLGAYKNALRYNYPDSSLHLRLGQVYQKNGQYDEAIKEYNLHLSRYPYSQTAINSLKGCIESKEWRNNPSQHHIRKLPGLNSNRSDFSPVYYQEDTTNLYWISTRPLQKTKKTSPVSGQPYSKLWHARTDQFNKWKKPEIVKDFSFEGKDIHSICFTKDGRFLYYTLSSVTYQRSEQKQIFRSERLYGKWQEGYPVFESAAAITVHPALSPKEDFLYFASDIPGGYGGMDIYRCRIYPDSLGKWENLGPEINTAGDELYPYIRDDETIYFSSDGHPGLGGLDIFQAIMGKSGEWEISNIGFPLNSEGDDFGFRFKVDTEKGILCSSRNNKQGYIDLFEFEIRPVSIYLEGYIMDRDGNSIQKGTIYIANESGLNEKINISSTGYYRFPLKPGIEYTLMASSEGYLNQPLTFQTKSDYINEVYTADFYLTPFLLPSLSLQVLYDFDSADIQPENRERLNEIIEDLKQYPYVTIEIISHTDRHGKEEYNQLLSENRSQTILNYLTKSGIEKERITIKNYGKDAPREVIINEFSSGEMIEKRIILTPDFISELNEEEQQKADQLNRRTEFKITGSNYGLF